MTLHLFDTTFKQQQQISKGYTIELLYTDALQMKRVFLSPSVCNIRNGIPTNYYFFKKSKIKITQ
ncbi:hypothetical protein BXY82_0800 [Gelidibacter sediminis]|uniref:Uncharacterized protein n=1 Tax=Gelidibacter sediminis TaxID=1608710 RepID=A0A4R7Q8Y5_9FLAO|nr:hypothetical protein BXY82_0800 [Gelidibacter sediminis]